MIYITNTCIYVRLSSAPEPQFTHGFSGFRVTRSLVLCVMFCRSLFVLFLLAIVLFVLLRFNDSDNHLQILLKTIGYR